MTAPSRPIYVAEPPAQYLVHPPLVVDCSILAGVLFQEDWQKEALLSMQGRSLKAPQLLAVEIASVALKKHRHGGIDIARDGLSLFAEMDIALFTVPTTEVFALALRYQLSTYDAAYLWLATELKAPLATFDEKLATAAQAHLSALP
ncbi:MAG: type II toxin-antitoxin system VapC family toxin [Rhodoferax sp.]|jgi:predicted nucleic acid-binding protein|nr:type II toxin-antitoxin system VapC family toxin [Rhodoferax sp.]